MHEYHFTATVTSTAVFSICARSRREAEAQWAIVMQDNELSDKLNGLAQDAPSTVSYEYAGCLNTTSPYRSSQVTYDLTEDVGDLYDRLLPE